MKILFFSLFYDFFVGVQPLGCGNALSRQAKACTPTLNLGQQNLHLKKTTYLINRQYHKGFPFSHDIVNKVEKDCMNLPELVCLVVNMM